MKLSNIVDSAGRGKRRRVNAIEKTVSSGIKMGTKDLKKALRIGKSRVRLSDDYLSNLRYKFRFTDEEEENIKKRVEEYFSENIPYSIVRRIDRNIYGQPIGWYSVIIIEE